MIIQIRDLHCLLCLVTPVLSLLVFYLYNAHALHTTLKVIFSVLNKCFVFVFILCNLSAAVAPVFREELSSANLGTDYPIVSDVH